MLISRLLGLLKITLHLYVAYSRGSFECAQLLLNHGADVNLGDNVVISYCLLIW